MVHWGSEAIESCLVSGEIVCIMQAPTVLTNHSKEWQPPNRSKLHRRIQRIPRPSWPGNPLDGPPKSKGSQLLRSKVTAVPAHTQ